MSYFRRIVPEATCSKMGEEAAVCRRLGTKSHMKPGGLGLSEED